MPASSSPPARPPTDDGRLGELTEALIALASGERARRLEVRGDGSMIDGVSAGLNMVADEIAERLGRDRARDAHLLESERLAVAGQMAARVAHEVNNPASFLLANLQVLSGHAEGLARVLAELRAAFPEGISARLELERVLGEGEADRLVAELRDICAENLTGVRRIATVVRDLNEHALAPVGLAAHPAAQGLAPHPGSPARRLRILLVDDDPLLLTAYRRLLEHQHEVAIAESGEAALELLARDPAWDAIVSDVVMPGVDGPELLRQLEARFPALVARTAFSSAGTYTTRTVSFADSLGDRFVTKPLDRGQLQALVVRLAAAGDAARGDLG